MLPTHFLKRYFPNTPNWLLGGLFLVFILWLVVLPIEIIGIAMGQELSLLSWIARFLYIWGYAISFFLILPLADHFSVPDPLGGFAIVLLVLFISSPVYLAIGALIATRKDSTVVLGILLIAINIVVSCFVIIWLIMFLFSD